MCITRTQEWKPSNPDIITETIELKLFFPCWFAYHKETITGFPENPIRFAYYVTQSVNH